MGWFDIAVVGVTSLGNLLKNGVTKIAEVSEAMDVLYTQNYREKELTARLVICILQMPKM